MPFIGFFVYRVNHPAIFSLGYAPWALYCWLRVAQAASGRATALWTAGLGLANISLPPRPGSLVVTAPPVQSTAGNFRRMHNAVRAAGSENTGS